jgi:hypothetical protein
MTMVGDERALVLLDLCERVDVERRRDEDNAAAMVNALVLLGGLDPGWRPELGRAYEALADMLVWVFEHETPTPDEALLDAVVEAFALLPLALLEAHLNGKTSGHLAVLPHLGRVGTPLYQSLAQFLKVERDQRRSLERSALLDVDDGWGGGGPTLPDEDSDEEDFWAIAQATHGPPPDDDTVVASGG